ncbi:carboxypeptidase regulatory-like domain-containing protein [Candidatus Parabeggiatoa sp. HSG14]|uniref:carboxypeptidase regulatory-like domain-containing protein n=1 Tax=Candidatus Parabeggiatoa sp. HSG14 TaxID=3055593 RepID=UPI0025A75E58|nr:carboxypeptidase regulatory-like domain-containing protein [Thiotrichales bacterium HSG14]
MLKFKKATLPLVIFLFTLLNPTSVLAGIWDNIKNTIGDAAESVGEFVDETAENVGEFVDETAENVGEFVEETAENVGDFVDEAKENIADNVSDVAEFVVDTCNDSLDFCDTVKPKGEVDIEPVSPYVGDTISCLVTGTDNRKLSRLSFTVYDSDNETIFKPLNWDVSTDEKDPNMGEDFTSQTGEFSTSDLESGLYNYILRIEDTADNHVEIEGSFYLAPKPKEEISIVEIEEDVDNTSKEPIADGSMSPLTDDITTVRKKIGNLDVYADIFEPESEDVFIAKGNVMLARADGNKVLSVDTDLRMDYVTNTVESMSENYLTALDIKANLHQSPEDMLVYFGDFDINASTNPPVLKVRKGGETKLESLIFLLSSSFLSSMTLKVDEVILHDVGAQFSQEIDTLLTLGDIVLSQSNNSTAQIKIGTDFFKFWNAFSEKFGKIPLLKLNNGTKEGTDVALEITADLFKKEIIITTNLFMDKLFGSAAFGATVGFFYDPAVIIANLENKNIWFNPILFEPLFIEKIGLSWSPPGGITSKFLTLPPASPIGVKIDKLSGLFDKIISQPVNFTAKVNMSLTDKLSILDIVEDTLGYKALSGEVALLFDIWPPLNTVELSGNVKLLEKITLGNARIMRRLIDPLLLLEGNVDIPIVPHIVLLNGRLYFAISTLSHYVEATGQSKVNLEISEIVPWIGGESFIGTNINGTLRFKIGKIDRAEFAAKLTLAFMDFGFRIDRSDINNPHAYVTKWGKTVKIRRATRSKNAHQEVVAVTSENDAIIINVASENSAGLFTLTFPDGAVYTPENTPTPESSDVDDIFFRRNEAANEAYYAIKQPELGDYIVEVLNTDDLGEYEVELWTPNTEPTITLKTLETAQEWDGVSPIDINWTDSDPDNNAEISLYYDTDNLGNNGALIAIDIMEDDDENSYQWTPDPNMSSGTYYIYAKIDDRENAPIFSYSLGKLTVNNPNAPATPQNLILTPGDGTITVNWDANNEDNLMGYRVYLSETQGDDVFEYDFGVGLTNEYEIQGVVNGREYEVAVSAINEDLLESLKSEPLQSTPNGTSPSGSPDVLINTDESSLDSKTLQIRVKNAGEFQLTSARVAFYQEENLVGFQTIGPLPTGEFQDITFQLDSEITESVLVKIDEVMPSELRTFNNVAVIQPTPISHGVEGNIQDESGNLLADALVEINGLETTTNEEGFYQITGLEKGEHTVMATKDGYNFEPQTVTVNTKNPNAKLTLTSVSPPEQQPEEPNSSNPLTPSFYFVFDDTGSMKEEIEGAILGLVQFIEELKATLTDDQILPFVNLLTFKDKDEIILQISTNDLDELLEQVNQLKAEGGKDCPEDSVVALNQAADDIAEGGTILFVTDAPPHDGDDIDALIDKLRQQGLSVKILLSEDDCGKKKTIVTSSTRQGQREGERNFQGATQRSQRSGERQDNFQKAVETYSRIVKEVGNSSSLMVLPKEEQESDTWLRNFQAQVMNIMMSLVRPTITATTPTYLSQGGTLDLDIIASGSQFNESSLKGISISGGIVVNTSSVLSANRLFINVTVPENTALGRYDVTINTVLEDGSTETTYGTDVIEVTEAANTPEILSIIPVQATRSQLRITVLVYGLNTHFNQQASQLSFDDEGIIVHNLIIHNDTFLEAQIEITQKAQLGLHNVTVITRNEIATENQVGPFLVWKDKELPNTITVKPPPSMPLCVSIGNPISVRCNNEKQIMYDRHIAPNGYVTLGRIAGNVTSEGQVSRIKLLSTATLTGGSLTGYVANKGIITDVTFVGDKIEGGILSGTITIPIKGKNLGVLKDVTLAKGTRIQGGILSGKITGDADEPALIENAKVLAGTVLKNVETGEGVIFE